MGVSGIIGVGKSTTLCRLRNTGALKTALQAQCDRAVRLVWLLEPSDLWNSLGWLQEFYKDPDANAFWFQFGVFDTHVDAVSDAIASCDTTTTNDVVVIVVERTMYCQRLFWEVQYDLKRAKEQEHQVYVRMWNKWRRFIPEPAMIFYLKTSTLEVAMERVEARAREEEQDGVTKAYQQHLLTKHNAWYTQPVAYPPGCSTQGIPCTHLLSDAPFHTDDNALAQLSYDMAAALKPLIKE